MFFCKFTVHSYLWMLSFTELDLLEWHSWSSLFSSDDFKSCCHLVFVLCMLWIAASNICPCSLSAFGLRPKTYRRDTEQDLLCSCMSSLVAMVMERWWNPGGRGRTESKLQQRERERKWREQRYADIRWKTTSCLQLFCSRCPIEN